MDVPVKHHPGLTLTQLKTIRDLCIKECNDPYISPMKYHEAQNIAIICGNVIRRNENAR